MMQSKSTKMRILDAAQRLMWSKNYGSTSVDAICKEADVRKGSFYHYFESKQDLALEVLEDQWDFALQHLLKPAFENQKKCQKQFEIFFAKLYEQYHLSQRLEGIMYGCPFGNFGGEFSAGDEPMRQKLDDIFCRFQQYFKESLMEYGKNEHQAKITADELITYFEGMLLLAKIRNDAEVIKNMTPGALRLIE